MTHPDPRHPPPDAAPGERPHAQPHADLPPVGGAPGAGPWPATPAGHRPTEPFLGARRIVPSRPELVSAGLVAVVLAGLGAALGPLWQWLTPGAEVLITSQGAMHANPHAETYFSDDAVFMLLGLGLGVVAAIGCWVLARRHRGPAQLAGLVLGCLLGAALAWQIGRHLGLAEFYQAIEHAKPGETFRRPAKLAAYGVLGVPGFAAAFMYTLLAGWSRWPDLRPPPPGPAWDLRAAGGYPGFVDPGSPEDHAR